MSQCIVPNWNLRCQRQEQLEGEESNRSSHVHKQLHPNPSAHRHHQHLVPMSNYEVAELTWENGQLAMHGLSGLLNSGPTRPVWGRAGDTLESIVHQATCQKQNVNLHHEDDHDQQQQQQTPGNISSSTVPSSSEGKWTDISSRHHQQMAPSLMKKRPRSDESKQCPRILNGIDQDEHVDRSACASATATFCRDNDTTMRTWASMESPRSFKIKNTDEDSANFCRDNETTILTWPSFESPPSLKTKTTDEDSACHGGSENQDDHETKTETIRCQSSRRSRAAAVHNQSERRRRDRINQKMKALQKLVPNASKTDKASMLDEVIEYLKQLQAQVQMMSLRNMPQMMMPMGMQQQLQMSLLSRMGMGFGLGMGMGMLDMSNMARTAPQSLPPLIHPTPVAAAAPAFVPPPFVVPPMLQTHGLARPNPDTAANNSVPLADPYCAFLAQSMNMDLYNKMAAAALYRQQQGTQNTQPASGCPPQSTHAQDE